MIVMMRFFVTSSLAVVLGVSWVACVGDDPVSNGGAATGDRLGPCFPDKKCKEGLECREPELICLTPGEPTPLPDGGTAPVDGGGNDSGSANDSSANDGSTSGDSSTTGDGGVCSLPTGAGIWCGTTKGSCPFPNGCCGRATGVDCAQSPTTCTPNGGKLFLCDSPIQCNGGNCCLTTGNGTPPFPACSAKIVGGSSVCNTTSPCNTGEKYLCRSDADCGLAGACIPTGIALGGIDYPVAVYGVCNNK
jgi:hypothetical protein